MIYEPHYYKLVAFFYTIQSVEFDIENIKLYDFYCIRVFLSKYIIFIKMFIQNRRVEIKTAFEIQEKLYR